MKYDRLWERLIGALDRMGRTTELEAGRRIEVMLPQRDGTSHRVEIIMTRREWDDLVTIPFGDFDTAFDHVCGCLRRVETRQGFLVYESYDLVPSEAATLPEDPRDMSQHRLEQPDGLKWVADPPDSQ